MRGIPAERRGVQGGYKGESLIWAAELSNLTAKGGLLVSVVVSAKVEEKTITFAYRDAFPGAPPEDPLSSLSKLEWWGTTSPSYTSYEAT